LPAAKVTPLVPEAPAHVEPPPPAHVEPPPAHVEPLQAPVEPPQALRADARYAVEVDVDLVGDSNFYLGFTEHISSGRLFVATYLVHPIGSTIDLSVCLAGHDEPLRLRGEVRWVRESSWGSDVWPGMGVRFDAISDEDRARIEGFVRDRDPLFF